MELNGEKKTRFRIAGSNYKYQGKGQLNQLNDSQPFISFLKKKSVVKNLVVLYTFKDIEPICVIYLLRYPISRS